MGSAVRRLELPKSKWAGESLFLLCSSVDPLKAGQACLELLGGITITTMNHTSQWRGGVLGLKTNTTKTPVPPGPTTSSLREKNKAGAEAAAARAVAAAPLPIASSAAASDSVVITVPDSLYGAPAAESLPSYQEEITVPETLYGAPASEPLPSYQEEPAAAPAQMVMDASFNFAVNEDEHKFEEEADRTGERTGSYSYQAPDGTMVKVRYTAGRNGFVILNPDEVLPQAPQV